MAITDIFNTSFFILLGICFIVIGVVGYYFSQIILQQNKKISGMVDLISTMAQEMEFIRSKTQQMSVGANTFVPQFFTGGSSGVSGSSSVIEKEIKTDLIPVSDDEDDEDDDDDDEEDDDDDDDEEDDDDEDDDEDEEDKYKDEKEQDNIRIINFVQQLNEQVEHFDQLEIIENEIEELDDDLEDSDDLEDDEDLEETEVEVVDQIPEEKKDFHFLKKLDVDISSLESKPTDYKKLSLEKLKSIAIEKNVEGASKMKKNELIKALENM